MNNLPENITHDLIVAFLNGETTIEESRLIKTWIEASDENLKYFEEIETIWIETGKLEPKPVDVDIEKAWNKLSSRIDNADNKTIKVSFENKKTTSITRVLLRVAAVIIPIAIISYMFLNQDNAVKQLAISTQDKTIEKTLSDGSLISLNTNTKLTYPQEFGGETREVSLEGEAFFNITPNKAKPFIIHSNDADIKVVGTSFNVKSYSDSNTVEVFVKTGKVILYGINTLTNDTSFVELEPETKGIFNKTSKTVEKFEKANPNDLFWKSRTLVFNKTKLSDVIKILNKYYGVQILLKNKKLNNCHLTATFNDQSIESILEVISTSFNLKVIKSESIYEIEGEAC